VKLDSGPGGYAITHSMQHGIALLSLFGHR
jgi:hypothetical protein